MKRKGKKSLREGTKRAIRGKLGEHCKARSSQQPYLLLGRDCDAVVEKAQRGKGKR